MKKLIVLLILEALCLTALAQQAPPAVPPNTTIERVDVSGVSDTRLTPDLRADIQNLAGQPYNAETAKQLAEGIQIELPEYVAAATPQPGSQPDRIRLVFVVAKIEDNDALKNNINARYIVDAVEIEGKFKPKLKLSDALNADLQKMVGQNLNNEQSEALRKRIQSENAAEEVGVEKKLRRGSSPNHVKIVYDVDQNNNNFGFSLSNPGYHSKEGFYGPTLTVTGHRVKFGTVTARWTNDADKLVERSVGGAAGYSVKRGSLKVGVEYSSLRAQWKPNTLEADRLDPRSPGLYRVRDTSKAFTEFKLPLSLSLTAEASFSGLQMQSRNMGYRFSNAFSGTLSSHYTKETSPGVTHTLGWTYSAASGTGIVDSDFIYTRHEVYTSYRFKRSKDSWLNLAFNAGRITGNAPMFERFSLGSRYTLRGWNKYEISPLGANRMANFSALYKYKFLTPFYDAGAVWNAGQAVSVRHSVGITIHPICGPLKSALAIICNIPITIGVPIRSGSNRPAFMTGY